VVAKVGAMKSFEELEAKDHPDDPGLSMLSGDDCINALISQAVLGTT